MKRFELRSARRRLFAGVRTIRGERPAVQATRRPLSYGRCRIANCDFDQLLTHETPDAVAVPVHQDSPLVSPSVAAAQSRDEARPLGFNVDPLGEAFRPIRAVKFERSAWLCRLSLAYRVWSAGA